MVHASKTPDSPLLRRQHSHLHLPLPLQPKDCSFGWRTIVRLRLLLNPLLNPTAHLHQLTLHPPQQNLPRLALIKNFRRFVPAVSRHSNRQQIDRQPPPVNHHLEAAQEARLSFEDQLVNPAFAIST